MNVNVYTTEPFEKAKQKISKAKKDIYFVLHGYSANDRLKTLEKILDAVINYLNRGYRQKHFT